MGILKVGKGALTSVLEDQWREYFYCPSMEPDVLVKRGENRKSKRSFNTKGSGDLITNGSIIAVNEGQCMMIVDQGAVVEVCAEPGEFVYDASTEPSIFYGGLKQGILESFRQFGRRFTMGGDTARDQRVYFFNTKEIIGNKYGTARPVPFRVVDANVGLDIDISIRCHGEYAYRIMDPILFYKNVCGNVDGEYRRESIDSQLKSEFLTALQPAFAKISGMGVRYSAIPGHTDDLAAALNEVLSDEWDDRYGIVVSSIGVSSVSASEEDEAMMKELQKNAVFRNPNMAAAHLVNAQAEAMQAAAKNSNAGPVMAFAGMNLAAQSGGANAQNLFSMGGQAGFGQNPASQGYAPQNPVSQGYAPQNPVSQGYAPQSPASQGYAPQNPASQGYAPQTPGGFGGGAEAGWICSCGTKNTGKFCSECGKKRPEPGPWRCSCGTMNTGKFCSECGKPRE